MPEQLLNFQAAFEALPGNFILLRPDAPAYTILDATDEALHLSQRTRPQIVGLSVFVVFPENPEAAGAGFTSLRASLDYVLRYKEAHQVPTVRYDVRNANGTFEQRYWSAQNKPVLDADGNVQYILHSTTEVTTQIRAERNEQALRDIERPYSLFMQAPVGICILRGPQHRVELINAELHRFLGTTPDIVGRPLFDALPDTRGQGFPELLDQVLATGQPYHGTEYAVMLPLDGREELRYYNFVYQPYYENPADRTVATGVFSIAHDVTEQVRARQRAEESEQHFRPLIDEAPIATALYLGPEMRIQYANSTMLSYWGKDGLVAGKTFRQTLPELADQPFPALLEQVYATGETYMGTHEKATLLVQGQAKTSYFNFIYKPLRNQQNEVYGVHHTAIDVTEEVLALHKIEESEVRFRSLVEQAPVAIALTRGRDVVLESINAPMLRLMSKQSAGEVLGKPLADVLPHLEPQAMLGIAQAVVDTGKTFRGSEVPILMRGDDGEVEQRYFNVAFNPLIEAGTVTGIIHTAIDVTEQVQARRQLEQSSEELKRFKFMAEQARDAFILIRQDGTFAYLNPQALDAWGYTAEEARRLRVSDVNPITPDEEFNAVFAQAQREDIPLFETLHQRKDGHMYPVEAHVVGLQLGGQPHLFGVARDITEQKRVLAALQESEQRFRIMADAAPNIVWSLNPDGSVHYVNKVLLDFLGLTLPQLMADTWMPYVHPEELEATQRSITTAIEERTLFFIEYRMRRHDGQYRWLLAQGAPSYYPSGELYGYVGSAIDITELKEANEQLRRTNSDLDNFIYTASHDLKAPITNIEGLLAALVGELPATYRVGDVDYVLEMMQDSVNRFKRTIEHLTDIARLQQEHAQPTTLVDLAAVVDDVCLDLAPLLRDTQAQLEVDVAACAAISFPTKNLRSVVYNLLSNALKYRHPDRVPRVQIRCASTPEHHVLTVADNGLGIEADSMGQLFQMFKRLHTHVEGSGVGLHMVKKMIENADGRIEVQSQPGVGTTFTVYFRR
ncbi:PAS domain-containing sensor histidine kinase [Hymenobacter weizhouensis]|uniref:PAS domain-containing sensor histidine kinase n=1 Tax=Hymenobacter sp. YIM 151500-1 TaxID=2987689 RepID=UPI002226B376|nr:PAS domain S-box protein [Hymenobacter sp. YIM 151500-1]UYZ61871.1 PAS domain S-box protein [Hymenobacter sp. YIM 151500-1]